MNITLNFFKNKLEGKLAALGCFHLLLAVDCLAHASLANCLSLFPVLNNINLFKAEITNFADKNGKQDTNNNVT